MALIQSNPTAEPELADQTGDYLNPATGHRAWFQKGDPLTPGYVPDDAPEIADDVDDAALRKAVAAETRDLEKKAKAAAERADKAEEERQEAQGLVERLEQEKADEVETLKRRIAELEAAANGDGSAVGGAKAPAETGGTPRANRRANQG